jgi:RNA polymerase sigma-70 factor (ECF subfamily)
MENDSSLSIEELVRICSSSEEVGAWEEFVRRLHRLIAKVVLRMAERLGDGSRQTVDDLIQEVYLKFCADNCKILREFDHRRPGAFLGFIQVVAANVVRDHFRSSQVRIPSISRLPVPDESFPSTVEDVSTGPLAIEREVLIQEVGRFLGECTSGPDQDRNIRVFWLYYRAGLSAGAIAVLPEIGLTTKGVESLIFRMTRDVRERMTVGKRGNASISHGAIEGIQAAEPL